MMSKRVGWMLAFTMCAGCFLCKEPPPEVPDGAVGPAVGPLSAGVAVVPVALPAGPSLAGYGGSPRREINASTILQAVAALGGSCIDPTPATAAVFFEPATGTKSPIAARALVLSNGTRKLAIVKLDTIGMSRKLRDAIAAAAQPLGIPAAYVAVVATHTHSGPGGVAEAPLWQVAAADCYSDAVFQAVKTAAVGALKQAHAALQPARLGVGTTTVIGANKNRRMQPAIVDQELGLVKVTTAGGLPLAALFNFAVHGTSYGVSNMKLSTDCMGAMEDRVETLLPGAVAIFTNGAEGDVAPLHRNDSGVLLEGKIVGDAVAALWPTVSVKPAIDLRAVLHDVGMPAPQYNPAGCLALAGSSSSLCDIIGSPLTLPLKASWLSTELPFQALRLDDTVFVAVPGEAVTEIGWNLKKHAEQKGFAHGFVLGLANDHGGYFTTVAQYQAATYEGTATLYGEETGAVVESSAAAVMDLVQ